MEVTLACNTDQPIPQGGVINFSVGVDGMSGGLVTAYAVVMCFLPFANMNVGLAVVSLLYNGQSPFEAWGAIPFGPGSYTMFARVNMFDSAGHMSVADSPPITVVQA